MDNFSEILSQKLKTYRKLKGWSQELLAEKASCSKSVVRDLEAKRRGASLEMISRIAEALDVELGDLFGKSPEGTVVGIPVSKTLKKMSLIPDDIFDLAERVGEDKNIWDAVKGTIQGQLSMREAKKTKKNQA